jgi:nuclear pore complex protein Nup160
MGLLHPNVFSLDISQNPLSTNANAELTSLDQQSEYFSALRRDWEGFLARCREIEKAARWPVSLGLVGFDNDGNRRVRGGKSTHIGGCIVLERERMGMLVGEDESLSLYRRIVEEADKSEEDVMEMSFESRRGNEEGQYQLVQLALSLKALLSPASWADVTHKLYVTIRENMAMTYEDLLLHLAQEVEMDDLDDETTFWVFNQLEAFVDGAQFTAALDAISMTIRSTGNAEVAEMVKQEDDEEEVGRMLLHQSNITDLPNSLGVSAATDTSRLIDHHNQWTRSLTASYLSATLESRYDITSSVLFLLMLLKSRNHEWMEMVNAVVIDELFAGLRSSSLLRQTASRVMENERENIKSIDPADDSHGNTVLTTGELAYIDTMARLMLSRY